MVDELALLKCSSTKTTRKACRSRYCVDHADEQEIEMKHSDKIFHDEICGETS